MLSSGKRSLSREDIKTANKDEKVSILDQCIGTYKERANTQYLKMSAYLAGNLTHVCASQETLLEHDSDYDEEMLFT